MRVITIAASEVAAAIGSNPYKTPEQYLDTLLRKYRGDISEEAEIIQQLGLTEVVNNLTNRTYTHMNPNDLKKLQNETIIEQFFDANEQFEEGKRRTLLKETVLQSITNKKFGTDKEDSVQLLHSTQGSVISKDETFYKLTITNVGDTRFQIVGRIDRLETTAQGERTIIEIKNRVHRLFKNLREYEKIQCLVYLQLVPNVSNCRLIENYDATTHEELISKNDLQEYWQSDVMPKLEEFCKRVHASFVP